MARLLVVDDEPDILDLIVRRMTQDGHEVLAADSAARALDLTERHGSPDAAVLDIDMPGMDGLTLLDQLRRSDPTLPALFLSVLFVDDVRVRIEAADAAFLPKPFTAADLRAGVHHLLDPAGTRPDSCTA